LSELDQVRDQVREHVQLPTGTLTLNLSSGAEERDALLGFAARANAKRGFLFLSKVLGKHWPSKPSAMAAVHARMAAGVPALPGPVLFIAMAETAIGLGQGVFEAWLRANPGRDALFIHSTRYRIGSGPLVEFEEAHSHAPRQFLHLPEDQARRGLLLNARSLVLVDDEASTGNTFLYLTAACRNINPAIQTVHLATITNFMGDTATEALSERFGLPVTSAALLCGGYRFEAGRLEAPATPAQRYDADAQRTAGAAFGRLGLERALAPPTRIATELARELAGPVLVLGTGEFMHAPYLLAAELEGLGVDVVVQSTTRSPILTWGAVSHALSFPDNYGEGIGNYLYNVRPGQYRHVLLCHETAPNAALRELAGSLNARLFHFPSDFSCETQVEEIPVR
jgi:hypothetical protein